jgi:predicted transposase YdaD
MAQHDELRSTMRLYAVEVMTANLLVLSLLQTSNPREMLARTRQQMIEGARLRGFPELGDAAMSDHYSAELENAVDRLLGMMETQLEIALRGRS